MFEVESERIRILEEPHVVDNIWNIGLVSLASVASKCIAGMI